MTTQLTTVDLNPSRVETTTVTENKMPPLSPLVVFIITFIVILIIVLVILWAVRPAFILVTRSNGDVDPNEINQCQLWLTSIVTSLVVTFIIALIYYAVRYR